MQTQLAMLDPGLPSEKPERHALMLRLLRLDARPGVRRAVAQSCAKFPGSLGEVSFLLSALAQDGTAEVRQAAMRGMATLLKRAAPMDRLTLLDAWATDEDERVRFALTEALSFVSDTIGLRTTLDLLGRDSSARVRDAAEDIGVLYQPC